MSLRLLLLTTSAFMLAGAAQAQTAPNSGQFATERDSLWQRAARVRTRTERRTTQFRTSFMALGGTRHKVVSYARLKPRTATDISSRFAPVKEQTTKYKTTGVEVEKVFYYGLEHRLLLTEYYEQHQLVRLVLNEYPLREGNEYGTVFRTSQWVRGDYLHLTTFVQEGRGSIQHYYFTALRPTAPN